MDWSVLMCFFLMLHTFSQGRFSTELINSIEITIAIDIFGTIAIAIAIAKATSQLLLLLLLRRLLYYCYCYCY